MEVLNCKGVPQTSTVSKDYPHLSSDNRTAPVAIVSEENISTSELFSKKWLPFKLGGELGLKQYRAGNFRNLLELLGEVAATTKELGDCE